MWGHDLVHNYEKKFLLVKPVKIVKTEFPIIEATIEEVPFILVNLYNANTQVEQIKTLCELHLLLDEFLLDDSKNIIVAGDFNLLFDPKLEAFGGSPTLKKNTYFKGS